jgi:hypothetical protein
MENGDARAISGSPSACLLVSVPRRDAHVAKNSPECRYCVRFALNNGERLFEPKWLAPQDEFEPRFTARAASTIRQAHLSSSCWVTAAFRSTCFRRPSLAMLSACRKHLRLYLLTKRDAELLREIPKRDASLWASGLSVSLLTFPVTLPNCRPLLAMSQLA